MLRIDRAVASQLVGLPLTEVSGELCSSCDSSSTHGQWRALPEINMVVVVLLCKNSFDHFTVHIR